MLVKKKTLGKEPVVETDDAIDFEDFINSAETEPDYEEPLQETVVRSVLDEILQEDNDPDIEFIAKVKFDQPLVPGVADVKFENDDGYDDSKDVCEGCRKECTEVKARVLINARCRKPLILGTLKRSCSFVTRSFAAEKVGGAIIASRPMKTKKRNSKSPCVPRFRISH